MWEVAVPAWKSQHRDVVVEVRNAHGIIADSTERNFLERAGRRRRRSQPWQVRLTGGHPGGAPDELFHAGVRSHPRPTRGTPTRGGSHRQLQPQTGGSGSRAGDGCLPFRGTESHALPGVLGDPHGTCEGLDPAGAGRCKPLEIFHDPRRVNVPVHPVPPHPGPCRAGRINKSCEQGVGSGEVVGRGVVAHRNILGWWVGAAQAGAS